MKRSLTRGLFTSIAATSLLVGLVAAPALAARPTTDKVTTGSWGKGVAVVDPTVAANNVTPSSYAAIDLRITLTNPGVTWDNGPDNVIGGCSAPVCVPVHMYPGVYQFPMVAGTGPVAGVGGHFNLNGTDSRGNPLVISLTIQSDTGFANLPSWAAPSNDPVTTGPWGQGIAVVDPNVPANDLTPSSYAAIDLKITLANPGLTWDNGPDNVIGGCGAPACLPEKMTPGVYKFPYVAGVDGVVAGVGGHFILNGTDTKSGDELFIILSIQSDPGFANLPTWATP